MPIEIKSTPAILSMESKNAELNIRSTLPRLQLHQEHVRINMNIEHPRIQIDQHECFVTSGLKGTKEMSADAAMEGMSRLFSYIGKVAADGDSFAAIENNGNVVAAIAEGDSYQVYEYNVAAMPKVRPKVYTKEGKVSIRPSESSYDIKSGVRGDFIRGKAEIQYAPGRVEFGLRQKPSISIRFIED